MRTLIFVALAGCGAEGTWAASTWGEEYIEEGLPAEIFADGCSASFSSFVVSFARIELVDGDGAAVASLDPVVQDVTIPGPTPLGEATVPADLYSRVEVDVDNVDAAGTVTCAGDTASFDWSFPELTTYACAPVDLTVPSGGAAATELTVHGDHLFYDGLEDPDAQVVGTAILDADGDADGQITTAELAAVSIPALGYTVGQFSDVTTLDAFVAHLSRTLVHVDGEGECVVSF